MIPSHQDKKYTRYICDLWTVQSAPITAEVGKLGLDVVTVRPNLYGIFLLISNIGDI